MYYKVSKGKYVISDEGCHIAFTKEKLEELKLLLKDIEEGGTTYLKSDNRND